MNADLQDFKYKELTASPPQSASQTLAGQGFDFLY